jgi:N-acetylated-alpha-linked acidic dipeptidase
LPGRPWFRHLMYAPGLYTGYGVKTLPGVREALEQKQFSAVEAEVVRAARAVERLVTLLDEASLTLAPAGS